MSAKLSWRSSVTLRSEFPKTGSLDDEPGECSGDEQCLIGENEIEESHDRMNTYERVTPLMHALKRRADYWDSTRVSSRGHQLTPAFLNPSPPTLYLLEGYIVFLFLIPSRRYYT